MHEDLQKLITAERKFKRELQELRQLRQKVASHKQPDPKVIAMCDAEIKLYLEKR